MRPLTLPIWSLLILILVGCSQTQRTEPNLDTIKQSITERFNAAYNGLLAISDLTLTPAQSSLNTEDHRVYDVQLTAVVQKDLQQALDELPDTMENAIARGRIKGIMSLGAVQPGQKITTRLRALVERNPENGQWTVVGLIRASDTPSHNTTEQGEHHAATRQLSG